MTHHDHMSPEMKAAVELAWSCRHECQTALFHHCLVEGGAHVERDHVRLMADCIQICQTAADFMTRQSSLQAAVCRACAEVCEACARSCETIGGPHMQHCAEVCRKCAESCRRMSGGSHTGEHSAAAAPASF